MFFPLQPLALYTAYKDNKCRDNTMYNVNYIARVIGKYRREGRIYGKITIKNVHAVTIDNRGEAINSFASILNGYFVRLRAFCLRFFDVYVYLPQTIQKAV